jgi:glycosyltransferase involved in cell wall biosynthesis
MINYSIIIPHKNIPHLLQRCLDSIPQREDLEIIVVDDNSDPSIVDFEHFPGLERPYTTVFFDKSGRGAGRARNVGLQHAQGKWILFVDADDFLLPSINQVLDDYSNSDADIVFFRPTAVMAEDLKTPSDRADRNNAMIDDYFRQGGETRGLFLWMCPWSKIIRHSIVEGVEFEEILYSNDNYFSVMAMCRARQIDVCETVYYVATQRMDSLTADFMEKEGELECRAGALLRSFLAASSSGKDVSCLLKEVKDFSHVLHNRNWSMYAKYVRCLMKNNVSFFQLLRDEYSRGGFVYRCKGYLKTCLHLALNR